MVSAREMFHSTNLIRRATDMFDWDRAFVNTIVDEKMFTFNKTILNTLSNFVLQETLTVDDQKKKKKISSKRKTMFTRAIENTKNNDNTQRFRRSELLQEDLYNEIQASKLNHYSGKKHIN